jgi:multidrug resistance protein, MATE family
MILMEAGLFFAAMLLASRFGQNWAAAHIVAVNVASLAFMLPLGLANAVTVRAGFYFGQKDRAAIWRVAQSGWCLCLASQALSALLMFACASLIVALYLPNEPAVAILAAQLLLLAAIFQFPDGIQAVSAGALRGVMDTRVPMLLAGISYWALGFPIAYYLSLHTEWGMRGLWFGFILGLSAAALLLSARFFFVMRRFEALKPQIGATWH